MAKEECDIKMELVLYPFSLEASIQFILINPVYELIIRWSHLEHVPGRRFVVDASELERNSLQTYIN